MKPIFLATVPSRDHEELIETTVALVCDKCGAIVVDPVQHCQWHDEVQMLPPYDPGACDPL